MDSRITKIRFCGKTNVNDVLSASLLGVHGLGFIFSDSEMKVNNYIDRMILKSEIKESMKRYLMPDVIFDSRAGEGKVIYMNFSKDKQDLYVLTGTLILDYVSKLVNKLTAYTVDVSSGIENEICKKDYNKMKKFVMGVRKC